jgi:hypothetical protein
MLRVAALVLALVAVFVACSGDGDDGGSGSAEDRERELRGTVSAAFEAFRQGEADEFYSYFSEDFRDRCAKDDFRAVMAIAKIFLSELDEDALQIGDITFESDDEAVVEATFEVTDGDLTIDASEDDDFLRRWVREEGGWKTDSSEDAPCDLEGSAEGDGDEDETPAATGPGTSREDAVAIGDSVRSGDLEITALDANLDAEDAVLALSEFNDPPRPGYRFVLIDVRVRHAGDGAETISVSSGDFRLTGSENVLYDGFGDSSCGFFDGQVQGEMFAGGALEGTVCFQVPEDETDLILVAQPFASFDDEDRRFIALE